MTPVIYELGDPDVHFAWRALPPEDIMRLPRARLMARFVGGAASHRDMDHPPPKEALIHYKCALLTCAFSPRFVAWAEKQTREDFGSYGPEELATLTPTEAALVWWLIQQGKEATPVGRPA